MLAYLNGEFLPLEDCKISVEDRGFTFADGVYEVWCSHDGVFAHTQDHLDRLRYSLSQLRIELPMSFDELARVGERLQKENVIQSTQLYVQVTRGAGPRGHRFPDKARPTVLVIARPAVFPSWEERQAGVKCIMMPDLRWGRCDIKSVSLLANVLATQAAAEQGAVEAILCRDGVALEGASSNLFAVFDGRLETHPAGPRILSGITRKHVLRYAEKLGLSVVEKPIPEEAVWKASELFITSVSRDVLPVTNIGGRPVGGGRMGPVSRAIYEEFHRAYWGRKPGAG